MSYPAQRVEVADGRLEQPRSLIDGPQHAGFQISGEILQRVDDELSGNGIIVVHSADLAYRRRRQKDLVVALHCASSRRRSLSRVVSIPALSSAISRVPRRRSAMSAAFSSAASPAAAISGE